MSDDEDNERMADIKIMRVAGTDIHRIEVAFKGHVTASIRWNDGVEEGRQDVVDLLGDSIKLAKSAFTEIDVADAAEHMDEDLANFFAFDAKPEPEDEEE